MVIIHCHDLLVVDPPLNPIVPNTEVIFEALSVVEKGLGAEKP